MSEVIWESASLPYLVQESRRSDFTEKHKESWRVLNSWGISSDYRWVTIARYDNQAQAIAYAKVRAREGMNMRVVKND